MTARDLILYEYLSGFCFDDYYFPMDGAFQNYTYFPRAALKDIAACWKKTVRLINAGKAPPEIGIYIHWPFCVSRCSFCFCSMTVPRSGAQVKAYLEGLKREMDALGGVFKDVRFSSVWVGGGTPTTMSAGMLDDLFAHLHSRFALASGAQVYVEASPASLTAEKMLVLQRRGVNRITLGVQSLDVDVLKTAGRRGQTRATAERALAWAAEAGMLIDMDLMLGLEGQNRLSFIKDLSWALKRGAQVLHVFAFDPKPQTSFTRAGKSVPPERRPELRVLMELADRILREAGYRMSRLDPETMEPDCPEERQDSAVRRRGASVLGLGASAISHAFGSAWYCHPLTGSRAAGRALKAGAIPPFHLLRSPATEEMRGYALRNLSLFGRLSAGAFRARFGSDPLRAPGLAAALKDLRAAGLLRGDGDALRYAGSDPVERSVMLKHLYSPALKRALMRGRGGDFQRYRRRRAVAGNGKWRRAIGEKMASRSLFRVYFRKP